jgi:hypothetical protein
MTQPSSRPADGDAVRMTLLIQVDCHYCDQAKAVLERIGQDHSIEVTEIDLSSDQDGSPPKQACCSPRASCRSTVHSAMAACQSANSAAP